MWVVFYHFWDSLSAPQPDVVAKGYLGVELFFVLSGFILSHVYLERFRNRDFNYREFLWARLARVYPLHIAIVVGLGLLIAALAVVGIHSSGQLIVWSSLPAQITLTQAQGLGPRRWLEPSVVVDFRRMVCLSELPRLRFAVRPAVDLARRGP